MKKGDKVRVIKISSDDEDTALYVGITGTVIKTDVSGYTHGMIAVQFDDMSVVPESAENLCKDGTYDMYAYQLEVIGEATICDGCKWEHWLPESSSEPWCPCDICDNGDQFERGEEDL